MAITYSNVFALLGEWVERTNEFQSLYATLDSYQTEVIADYSGQSQWSLMAGIPNTFTNFKNGVRGWIGTVNTEATKVLTDLDLVRGQLPIGGATETTTILIALWKDMVDNSQTIKPNVVTVGSVTMTVANADAGTILVSKVLDGYNAPGNGMSKNRLYDGVDSELSCDDSVTVKCIQDSESGNANEGGESWVAYGSPANDLFGWKDEGSGMTKGFNTLNSVTNNYLTNAEFEDFTSNAPDSWTLDNGTAGTHIFSASGVDAYRGDAALKFLGNGSQATIEISQEVSGQLNAQRRYLVACYVKGVASTLAGTLTIKFTGTGYTASSSEKIEMDSTALSAQTSYGLEYFWINMPAEVPDDFALSIAVTGTLTNAKAVYVDGLAFGPVTYENGVCFAAVAGADKFLVGDQGTFTVANDEAGVFQTWFRKTFGFQLPSDASPSIADSLAT